MPSSTSFNHPSLVLGGIADVKVLGLLTKMASCQSKIDTAQDKLNSLIAMKRSMSMTINELVDMQINVDEMQDKIKELESKISAAASAYLSARMSNETAMQSLKEQLNQLESGDGEGLGASGASPNAASLESPVDFGKSALKNLPLSAESIKLDSQYFSFGSNPQNDTLANIEKFVRSSNGDLGAKANDLSKTVTDQIGKQYQNHNIAGTLIITASCTHRNVSLFAPLVIDPDKAVAAWNALNTDKIDVRALATGGHASVAPGGDEAASLSLVTGASYGSSFVGMVHILKNDTDQSADMDEIKKNLEDKLRSGGWLQNSIGGLGVDETTLSEIKAFLSTQSVSSHIGVVTLGAVPSLKSNNLSLSVRKMAEFDPQIVNAIASNGASETGGVDTVSSQALEATSNKKILEIQNARVSNIMKTLGKIDQDSSKVMDITSLINAFESYIETIRAADANTCTGVPINVYLKKLTKPEIAQLWCNKYQPNIANKGDSRE